MPRLYYQVESIPVNIFDPIADEIVNGLLKEFGLFDYFKDSIYTLTPLRAYSQVDDRQGNVNFIKNRADINVRWIMNQEDVVWPATTPYNTPAKKGRSTTKGDHRPIFMDLHSRIQGEEYTTPAGLDMDFKLTFQTSDMATSAFRRITSRYIGTLISDPFDIYFSYPVSKSLLEFMGQVYSMRKDFKNKSFLDYLKSISLGRMSFDVRKSELTNPNADRQFMIRTQQLRTLGQLTFDMDAPEEERENNLPDRFILNFNFKYQFGCPTEIVVDTPVVVDNQVLPPSLFRTIHPHYNHYILGQFQDRFCESWISRSYGNYGYAHMLVRLPGYDDWVPKDVRYGKFGYRPFIIANFTLDGKETTFNISQLDDIALHPVLIDILKTMGNNALGFGGLFHVGVFADQLMLDETLVSLDEDLNLTVRSNCPDRRYYLVISETTQLQQTEAKWDSILLKYRCFFPMTIERNLQTLINKGFFKIDTDNRLMGFLSRLKSHDLLLDRMREISRDGDAPRDMFQYTQNAAQLADYLCSTAALREQAPLPDGDDPGSVAARTYLTTVASVYGRSLYVALMTVCLLHGDITLDQVPPQYLTPNTKIYPYSLEASYYGFNTPLRVFEYTIGQ